MKILKFKLDDSFFELHAAFEANLDIQTDYVIQKSQWVKRYSKQPATKFLFQDTYSKYEESNSVYRRFYFMGYK